MNRYSMAAILSGVFFGCISLFTRTLSAAGMSTMGILAVRCSVAAVCFFCTAANDLSQLRLHKKDLPLFLAVGILGQGMFSLCYYSAINMMSASTACILLYLSPAIVTVLAHFIFKDKITRRTVFAVILCVVGCAFVSGFGGTVSGLGVICGLGSALTFALINIWDRMLLQRGYTSKAVNFYLCVISMAFGILMDLTVFRSSAHPISVAFGSFGNLAVCLGLGVISGFLPYLFFSKALSGCESGKVSILASTEPVTATLLSVCVFHEPFGVLCIVGIILVLVGIVLQNSTGRETSEAK